MKKTNAFNTLVVVTLAAAAVACSPSLRTKVVTLSERPPAAESTYRLELSDDQTNDLEVARIVSGIHGRMSHAGFVEAESPESADITLRFAMEEGSRKERPDSGMMIGASRGSEVRTSQSSVAGVPVPGTRRTTVSHPRSTGVGMESPGTANWAPELRLELMFADREGPSHKVTVSAPATHGPLQEIAPCLIEAAFEQFPRRDGQETDVAVDLRDCRAG